MLVPKIAYSARNSTSRIYPSLLPAHLLICMGLLFYVVEYDIATSIGHFHDGVIYYNYQNPSVFLLDY